MLWTARFVPIKLHTTITYRVSNATLHNTTQFHTIPRYTALHRVTRLLGVDGGVDGGAKDTDMYANNVMSIFVVCIYQVLAVDAWNHWHIHQRHEQQQQ